MKCSHVACIVCWSKNLSHVSLHFHRMFSPHVSLHFHRMFSVCVSLACWLRNWQVSQICYLTNGGCLSCLYKPLELNTWMSGSKCLCVLVTIIFFTIGDFAQLFPITSYFSFSENGWQVWPKADPWIWQINTWFGQGWVGGKSNLFAGCAS